MAKRKAVNPFLEKLKAKRALANMQLSTDDVVVDFQRIQSAFNYDRAEIANYLSSLENLFSEV